MIVLRNNKAMNGCEDIIDAFDTVEEFKNYMKNIYDKFNSDMIKSGDEPLQYFNAFELAKDFGYDVLFY